MFYNIFFIYSYDTDNTLIDNTLRKVGPLFKSNFSNSDYEIIKQAFQFNLFHYKHIKHMKNAFKLLFTFVPNSYICQDWSIQKDVQNFLMNKTELFDYCCCFFYKISKAHEAGFKIDLIPFIKLFFTRVKQYIEGFITIDHTYKKVKRK